MTRKPRIRQYDCKYHCRCNTGTITLWDHCPTSWVDVFNGLQGGGGGGEVLAYKRWHVWNLFNSILYGGWVKKLRLYWGRWVGRKFKLGALKCSLLEFHLCLWQKNLLRVMYVLVLYVQEVFTHFWSKWRYKMGQDFSDIQQMITWTV